MDGVKRTLTVVSVAAVVSMAAVVSSVALHGRQEGSGAVWYPSMVPGGLTLPYHLRQPPRLYQHLVLPRVYLQWVQQNGTYVRPERVHHVLRNGKCSHSSQDEEYPHLSREQYPLPSQEQYPGSSQEQYPDLSQEQYPHSSQEQYPDLSQEQYPHSSREQYPDLSQEQYPHSSQEQYPDLSQEQYPHPSQEQFPHPSQEQFPHPSREQFPHPSREQYPHPSREQFPHPSQEQFPHPSQEQYPHYSQDEEHFLKSLPSDEYDLIIGPPLIHENDPSTTVSSLSDNSDQLLPARHYDLTKLTFAAREQLKSVGSLEDLLRVPGFIQLLEDEDPEEEDPEENPYSHRSSRMYRPRGQMRRRGITPIAECEVEKFSLKLKTPPGSKLIPSCVKIGRCGGCCDSGRSCTPTRTNTLSLTVYELTEDLTMIKTITREVEEAVECRCQCQIQASKCDPLTQEYDPANCQCVCKSSLEEEQTRCDASPKHRWNPYHCACMCIGVGSRECSSGHTFYEDTCRCETNRQE